MVCSSLNQSKVALMLSAWLNLASIDIEQKSLFDGLKYAS